MGIRKIVDGIVQINPTDTEVIGDTAGMTDEEFGKARVGIGGSTVSCILGTSPYTTITEEYYKQIGQPLKAPVSGEAERLKKITFASGHLLEDTVAQMAKSYFKFYKNTDIEMVNDTRMFRSKKYPWATANLDRWGIITHDDGSKEVVLIEIKTTSLRNRSGIDEWKAGIVPAYYECQVRHYMAVLDIDHAYICCAWGQKVDDESMAVIRIDRDLAIEKTIMEAESDFWNCVQFKVPPSTENQNQELLAKFYARLYGAPDEKLPNVQLSGYYASIAEELQDIDAEMKKLEKRKAELTAKRAEVCNHLLPCFVDPETGEQLSSYASYYNADYHTMVGVALDISRKAGGIDVQRLKEAAPEVVEELGQIKIKAEDLKKYDKSHDTHYYRDFNTPKSACEVNDDPEYKWKVTVKEGVILPS